MIEKEIKRQLKADIQKVIKRLKLKYNVNIIYNIHDANNKYYVYSKAGALEFKAHDLQDLISTLHLYYD